MALAARMEPMECVGEWSLRVDAMVLQDGALLAVGHALLKPIRRYAKQQLTHGPSDHEESVVRPEPFAKPKAGRRRKPTLFPTAGGKARNFVGRADQKNIRARNMRMKTEERAMKPYIRKARPLKKCWGAHDVRGAMEYA